MIKLNPILRKLLFPSCFLDNDENGVLAELLNRIRSLKALRMLSAQHYADFLKFTCDIGRLDVVYFVTTYLDKESACFQEIIAGNKEVERIYNFHSDPIIKELQLLSVSPYKKNNLLYVKETSIEYLHSLDPTTATYYENMILNFYLVVLFSHEEVELSAEECIKFFNYFHKAKSANRLRKDNVYLLIIDYCIKNNISDYFRLPKRFYNHIQKGASIFQNKKLLSNKIRKCFSEKYLNTIRKNNSLATYREKPRIALCISGIYRNHQESLNSIIETFGDLDAEVFIHTWDVESIWSGLGGSPHCRRIFGPDSLPYIPKEFHWLTSLKELFPNTFRVLKQPINRSLSDDLERVLAPTDVVVENEKVFIESLGNLDGYTRLRPLPNQIKMFYGIKRSFDLALKHANYDYLIRVRPDIIINKDIENILDKLMNNHIYTATGDAGLADSLFIVSSSMAYNFSRFVDDILEFKELSIYKEFPLYDSHNLLGLWVLANNYLVGPPLFTSRVLPNAEITLPKLKKAIEKDFKQLSSTDQEKYTSFKEYLLRRNG